MDTLVVNVVFVINVVVRNVVEEITPEMRDVLVDMLWYVDHRRLYCDVPLVLGRFNLTVTQARHIVLMTDARRGPYENRRRVSNALRALCVFSTTDAPEASVGSS